MITDQARPFYAAMVDDLLAYYIKEGQYKSDTALFVDVSVRFGQRMLTEVCPHLDMQIGECAVGAIAVMREAAARLTQGGVDASRKEQTDGG